MSSLSIWHFLRLDRCRIVCGHGAHEEQTPRADGGSARSVVVVKGPPRDARFTMLTSPFPTPAKNLLWGREAELSGGATRRTPPV